MREGHGTQGPVVGRADLHPEAPLPWAPPGGPHRARGRLPAQRRAWLGSPRRRPGPAEAALLTATSRMPRVSTEGGVLTWNRPSFRRAAPGSGP